MPPEEPPDLQIPVVRRLHSIKRKAETEPRRRYAKKLPPRRDEDRAASLAVEVGKTISQAFFSQSECPEKVIEIAFPILEDERHLRKYLKNPEAFVVTSLRKKRVEISEKKLSPEEKELIRLAKGKEIKEFLKEHVCEKLRESELVDPKDIMKMRFVLTWKKNEDGTKKGKARLALYLDSRIHTWVQSRPLPQLSTRDPNNYFYKLSSKTIGNSKRVMSPRHFSRADLCRSVNMHSLLQN